MFGWKRRALDEYKRQHDAMSIGWYKTIKSRSRSWAKLAGRAATIRRLLEEVRDAASRERITDVLICESGIRADKAEAERDNERANRRHWEQTAGEINEDLARVRAERDAALEALHTIAERFGEVMRLLGELISW